MNEYDVKVKSDATLLEQPTDVFAAANGNGSTKNNLLTAFGTEYVFYALYQKPNGLSPERYLMIADGTESVEVSPSVFETWNKYTHIIPSPVFDIESSVTQNVTGQYEAWYFVPETGFLGIVQLSTSLFTTFTSAVDGDFARVVFTNTDWQLDDSVVATAIALGNQCKIVTVGTTDFTLIGSANNTVGTVFTATGAGLGTGTVEAFIDSTTTIVGEESRVPTEEYLLPIDPSINTGLPVVAPDNTEIIISVLNGKLSKAEAVANYVNQDFSIYNTDTNITATYTIVMNDDSGNPKVVEIGEAVGDVSGALLKVIYTPTADGLGYTNIVDAALKLWNGKADTTKCEILTNQDGSVTVNLGTGETMTIPRIDTTTIDYNAGGTGGEVSWNATELTTDRIINSNVTIQDGRELLKLGRNTSGVTITNGQVVAIIGSVGNVAEIELLDITDPLQSFKVIGTATEDILNNAVGNINLIGRVRGLDTSGWIEGTILYADINGELTSAKPTPPNRCVLMAVVETSNAGAGVIWQFPRPLPLVDELSDVEITTPVVGDALMLESDNVYRNTLLKSLFADKGIQNGQIKESFDLLYDIPTSTMILTKNADDPTFGTAPNELTMQFSTGEFTLSLPQTFTLTFGSTTALQDNWLYIPLSTKLPATATGFDITWANEEHIRVSFVSVLDEAYTDTEGAFINQNWNNHASGTDYLGALQHIRAWIRSRGAKYDDGVAGLGTDNYLDDSTTPGTLYWKSSSGLIWQMHPQTFMAHDTEAGDDIHVANYFGENYKQITTFNEFDTFSDGTAIGNEFFNVVMYGVANKSGQYSPLLANISTAGYNGSDDAINDVENLSVYDIDRAFTKDSSTAFAIARVTMRKIGTAYTYIATTDLRDANAIIGGGGGAGQDTEFFDTVFKIINTVDSTKKMLFDLALLTTGNSRTLQPQDKSYVIADKANVDTNAADIVIINNKLDNSTIEQTYDELHESTFGAIDPINGSPELVEALGLSLTSGVVNGDFPTDIANWATLLGGETATWDSGSLQMSTSASIGAYYQEIVGVSTDVWYVKATVTKTSGTGCAFYSLPQGATAGALLTFMDATTFDAMADGETRDFSGLITLNNAGFRIVFGRTSAQTFIANIDDVQAIKLTDTPLLGKTAVQMDAIVDTWFEDTKSIVDFSLQSIGKQLFDKNTNILVDQNLSGSGTPQVSAGSFMTEDYISVQGGTGIVWGGSTSVNLRIAEYDSSQTFIKLTSVTIQTLPITLDSNTRYVRVSSGSYATIDTYQLEQGTVATTYAPYNSDTISFPNTTLRSVDTAIRDRVYENNGVWTHEQYVGYVADESIGATINYADMPTGGVFEAVDTITFEIQTGVKGDVLTLTNVANVRYELTDKVDTLIDKDGGLIQENPTTLIQTGLSTECTLKFNLDSSAQIITNTKNNQNTQKQVDTVEVIADANTVRSTDNETNIGTLANLTTTNKNDLVNAISENEGRLSVEEPKIVTLQSEVVTLQGQSTLLYSAGFSVEIATTPTGLFTLSNGYTNYDALELEILLTEDAGGVTEATHFRRISYDIVNDKIFSRFEMTRSMTETSIINSNFLLANVSGSEVNMNAYYGSKWTSTTANSISRATDDDIVISKVYGINYV